MFISIYGGYHSDKSFYITLWILTQHDVIIKYYLDLGGWLTWNEKVKKKYSVEKCGVVNVRFNAVLYFFHGLLIVDHIF